MAILHVLVKTKFDPAKAKKAGERMLAISRSIKPTRAKGGTALVRELRESSNGRKMQADHRRSQCLQPLILGKSAA